MHFLNKLASGYAKILLVEYKFIEISKTIKAR